MGVCVVGSKHVQALRPVAAFQARSQISHVIPSPLFQTLNSYRRNSAVFSPLLICLTTELRAKLVTSFGSQQQHVPTHFAGPETTHSHSPGCRHRDLRRQGLHAPMVDELAQTDIKISEILRSVGEHCQHNTRIVMACARLYRRCARSHFALQLLGF